MRIRAQYAQVRKKMQPGDVIAFGGKGGFSDLIKRVTGSRVSHVATILQSKVWISGGGQPGFLNQIIESTTLEGGLAGVQVRRLSDKLQRYEGQAWWLPLSDEVRKSLNLPKFFNFLLRQEGKPYDMKQAVRAGLDFLNLGWQREDFEAYYCSELVVAGLEAGGAFTHPVNASGVIPKELVQAKLYQPDYYQIWGHDRDIEGYNSRDPAGWAA